MADSKITALTSISTSTDPANDPLVIVDVSDTSMAASGTTKKVTLNQLLGASGTATLASATITGDLTVKTNVLKVDTTNNRVGIGTASPNYDLEIAGAVRSSLAIRGNFAGGTDIAHLRFINANGSIVGDIYAQNTNGGASDSAYLSFNTVSSGTSAERYRIASDGVATWSNVGGVAGTAMTLNANGLGIGVTPTTSHNLSSAGPIGISGTNSGTRTSYISNSGACAIYYTDGGGSGFFTDFGNLIIQPRTSAARSVVIATSAAAGTPVERLIVDPNGNVGIGVTPSAWRSTNKALQVGSYSSLTSSSAGDLQLFNNAYINSGGANIYQSNGFATRYEQYQGVHAWYTAPSGTAGNTATFTQAMTLDASGNLLVGTTGLNGSWNTKLTLSNDSGTTKWAVGPYLGGVTNFLISAGASAGVYLNGTAATSWTSASDERLKDIIEPISNAIAKVGSLRAVIGKFKFDENNTRKPFLIAQDIQAVLPEAVDASNPEKLGVAYTDVIPLLVAAIKELTARVQTLETR